jgi:alkylation response protein AidB-like acyl-CoA dehydrogenase
MATQSPAQRLRGGAWLLEASDPAAVVTPERLTEEHRLIAGTAREFVDSEVMPLLEGLEQHDWDLARSLIRRCGFLGLLGVDIPETYGGVGLDKVSSIVVSEKIGRSGSFAATFGAQANLSILPIYLFGTEEQKRKYLPGLVSGELVGAYALSESGAGSDALGGRTRAVRQSDGTFLLSGEKMWITNGGIADLYIVFAKADGDRFTAFIVDRDSPGVTHGKEEHKMGLRGSSTTPLVLTEARVPAENLLGEIGKGHKVAFNVLNFGRFKLGAMCNGAAHAAIGEAARYAAERKQFGHAIASFGAIRQKLGEMVVRAYGVESLLYRTAGMIDARLDETPGDGAAAALAALEEYAIEASIAKVAGSEMIDFVVDENVQIHGGNGFVSDYPAERHYRDARVNRIFEGTNEINRLLIPGMLARRAVKGEIPIIPAAKALQQELLAAPAATAAPSGAFSEERLAVNGFKKTMLMTLSVAMQTYGEQLADQQEVLMHVADMAIDVFSAESALLRAVAAASTGAPLATLHADAARVLVNDAGMRIEASARQALPAMTEGDMRRTLLAALRRMMKVAPVNTVELRRRIADEAVKRGGYPFGG